MSFGKTVFIAYAGTEADSSIARRGHEVLRELIGDRVHLREFDLKAGELIANSLSSAISKARWFIILLNKAFTDSKWFQLYAKSILGSIDNENFRVLVVRLDSTPLPSFLQAPGIVDHVTDLTNADNTEETFIDLANLIDQYDPRETSHEIYEGRGKDADRFSLVARRNRIVFVLGIAGIGKNAFITKSVPAQLEKRPRVVTLTQGHSADYLARQILQVMHARQPVNSEVSDTELMSMAIDALAERADDFFLFIDDARHGLDESNRMLPYIEDLLYRFIRSNINTHIILATTRVPEYGPRIADSTDQIRLGELEDVYIREIIYRLLEGIDQQAQFMKLAEMDELVGLVRGHPLAARMLAIALKGNTTPRQLLQSKRIRTIQAAWAEHIIRSAVQGLLSDLDTLLLQTMAFIKEPLVLEDLLAIRIFSTYSLDEIQDALSKLTGWFLIEYRQSDEMLFLHSFLATYFREQLSTSELEPTRQAIAADFGHYAYQKVLDMNQRLIDLERGASAESNEEVVRLANEIFRYMVPASRLLRIIKREELVAGLPYEVKGTLREMVFYFYQEEGDYLRSLEFARRWLEIAPGDLEIMLYQARCYRMLGGNDYLQKAQRILAKVHKLPHSQRFEQRILRERAIIEEFLGNVTQAKSYYRDAIRINLPNPYPEVYVGLARILVEEAEVLVQSSGEENEIADEALHLLETARNQQADFDQFHLGLYIEALIQSGNKDTAFSLLENALNDNPSDGRLNYRMAEIKREQGIWAEAIRFAQQAIRDGYVLAYLTLANARYGMALPRINLDSRNAQTEMHQALNDLATFRSRTTWTTHSEVADGIEAKIHRTLGDWDKAHEVLQKYPSSRNPYTIYEQSKFNLWEADEAISKQKYGQALDATRNAIARIRRYPYELPQPLSECLAEALNQEERLERILQSG